MNKETEGLAGLSEMIEMARADNVIKKSEYQFILNHAHALGVDKGILKDLLSQKPNRVKRLPVSGDVDHFHKLIQLMKIDGEIHSMEQGLLQILGLGMGFRPSMVKAMLEAALEHPNELTLYKELMKIYKKTSNKRE